MYPPSDTHNMMKGNFVRVDVVYDLLHFIYCPRPTDKGLFSRKSLSTLQDNNNAACPSNYNYSTFKLMTVVSTIVRTLD